jgi:D-alanyl-lipoteichoic acid acyltransferase DltB (MBOAT superfamily)
MVFSSSIFLFFFFPLVLLGYFLLRNRFQAANVFLLLASLLFYAWGEPKFVFVMIGSIAFNYAMAMLIDYLPEDTAGRKAALFAAAAANLAVLFLYKYLDFTIPNLNRLFGLQMHERRLTLPIGISFFTFQAMSYVFDVYRGSAKAQRKARNVGLYIALFPQLIAGPIVRYTTIADQTENREFTFGQFSDGMHRFLIGLGKKILLANQMALLADTAFNIPYEQRSFALAWVGAFGYSLQILFDRCFTLCSARRRPY